MNLSLDPVDPSSELLFVDFNQDCSSLSVGTRNGYRLFSLVSPIEGPEIVFEKEGSEVCIVERLFSSSLVAIVELSNPRKLRLCHFKKNSEICTYSYPDTVLSVHLNRQRLIVVLKHNLYIHNIRDMKVMHTIRDTPKNPFGLCALSTENETALIAYPGSNQNGEVQVFDAMNLRAIAGITAHDSPLAAVSFNSIGNKLATASTTGTVIRVFSIPQGEKLIEFRRGMKRFIQISSLSFSSDSTYLITSSSTETVHVFRVTEPSPEPVDQEQIAALQQQQQQQQQQQGWMSYLGKALSTPASYLPSQVTEPFSQSRAFAQIRLPKTGMKSVSSVTSTEGVHRILVATSEGILYVATIDPKEGGECRYTSYSLLGNQMPLEPSTLTGLTGGHSSSEVPIGATPIISHDSHTPDESPPRIHTAHS